MLWEIGPKDVQGRGSHSPLPQIHIRPYTNQNHIRPYLTILSIEYLI